MVVYLHANSLGGGGGGGGTTTGADVLLVRGTATSVPVNAETTVVSRTVPNGYSMKLHGIVPSGNADAEWVLYKNGVEEFRMRTGRDEMGKPYTWVNPLSYAAGDVVALRVIHQTSDLIGGSTARNFYAALIYRDA